MASAAPPDVLTPVTGAPLAAAFAVSRGRLWASRNDTMPPTLISLAHDGTQWTSNGTGVLSLHAGPLSD